MTRHMLDRVANAIMEAATKANFGENHEYPSDLPYVDFARAAIKAMRKPTSGTVRGARETMLPKKRPNSDWVSNSVKHRIRYQAMIDVALIERGKRQHAAECSEKRGVEYQAAVRNGAVLA